MIIPKCVLLALFTLAAACQAAQPDVLQKTLRDDQVDESWIYNDLAKGMEEARKSKKPLLITLRCVP
jgi:serine protease Do